MMIRHYKVCGLLYKVKYRFENAIVSVHLRFIEVAASLQR